MTLCRTVAGSTMQPTTRLSRPRSRSSPRRSCLVRGKTSVRLTRSGRSAKSSLLSGCSTVRRSRTSTRSRDRSRPTLTPSSRCRRIRCVPRPLKASTRTAPRRRRSQQPRPTASRTMVKTVKMPKMRALNSRKPLSRSARRSTSSRPSSSLSRVPMAQLSKDASVITGT